MVEGVAPKEVLGWGNASLSMGAHMGWGGGPRAGGTGLMSVLPCPWDEELDQEQWGFGFNECPSPSSPPRAVVQGRADSGSCAALRGRVILKES